ncbi:MAG TPA: peptide ABC transporter substrate-binding protein [Pyrinomonadaceae bacterium]|jgi:ABC-type oligopeptide transport system substrate-binding subunit
MSKRTNSQKMNGQNPVKRFFSLRALHSLDALLRRVTASSHLRVWRSRRRISFRGATALLVIVAVTSGGCFMDTEIEPYYGRMAVPRTQEFRWSDGGLPQVFDPALAAAPPDTDAVRAMFEGLTEYDPRTLAAIPGVAARWESSADTKQWTFHLRQDARWSNSDPVTAHDFVRSWQRTVQLGERAPHARLLENIVGVELQDEKSAVPNEGPSVSQQPSPNGNAEATKTENKQEGASKAERERPAVPAFGVEAMSDHVLRVRLKRPDPSFPSLVAHPVFRPIHGTEELTLSNSASARVVSNGAFQLTEIGRQGVVLERAKHYWDTKTVALERVQFVATENAEAALAAYRAGEVDAVTNAGFEPLALKLLAPYKDFRRATYGALTYYSFNTNHPPFGDVRVREALAIAIDRDRISEDEMGGATEPAKKFLPVQTVSAADAGAEQTPAIVRDVARAQSLLSAAGYPEGRGFPRVKLLINRNEQQRIIAQRVASMWRSALGIETDVVMKNWDEYEAALRAGDYDVVRRSVVMQTMDEATNLRAIFDAKDEAQQDIIEGVQTSTETSASQSPEQSGNNHAETEKGKPSAQLNPPNTILTEAQALKELPAIPIYFASSYALVKPYVTGFDSNLLDAPSLKTVRIETTWQPPKNNAVVWSAP